MRFPFNKALFALALFSSVSDIHAMKKQEEGEKEFTSLSQSKLQLNPSFQEDDTSPTPEEAANALIRYAPEVVNSEFQSLAVSRAANAFFEFYKCSHNRYGFSPEGLGVACDSKAYLITSAIQVRTLAPYFDTYGAKWASSVFLDFRYFEGMTLQETNAYLSVAGRNILPSQAAHIFSNVMSTWNQNPSIENGEILVQISGFQHFMAALDKNSQSQMSSMVENCGKNKKRQQLIREQAEKEREWARLAALREEEINRDEGGFSQRPLERNEIPSHQDQASLNSQEELNLLNSQPPVFREGQNLNAQTHCSEGGFSQRNVSLLEEENV